ERQHRELQRASIDKMKEAFNLLKDPKVSQSMQSAQKYMRENKGKVIETMSPDWVKKQKIIEYFEVLVRVRWNYYKVEMHKIMNQDKPANGPDVPDADSSVSGDSGDGSGGGTNNAPSNPVPSEIPRPQKWDIRFEFNGVGQTFIGRMWKTFPLGNDRPPDYGFENFKPEGRPSVAGITGFQKMSSSSGSCVCGGKGWKPDPSGGGFGASGSSSHAITVSFMPGVTIDNSACQITAAGFVKNMQTPGSLWQVYEHPPLWFRMTQDDVNRLIDKGYWSKTVSGVKRPGGRALLELGKLSADTLTCYDLYPGNKYEASLTVEMFLEPSILGPHYMAHPVQVTEPAPPNRVVLSVPDFPGYTVSAIEPVDGWDKAEEFVKKENETPPPAPTLTLAPKKPGKVDFKIKWTNKENKKGESPPFDMNVVELRFNEGSPCSGFDDVRHFGVCGTDMGKTDMKFGAVSVCENAENQIWLEAKSGSASFKTKLQMDAKDFVEPMPDELIAYPAFVTLKGIKAGDSQNPLRLEAKVEIEPDRYQTAAQLDVYPLKVRTLRVKPIVQDPIGNQAVPFPAKAIMEQTNNLLKQVCVKLDIAEPSIFKSSDFPDNSYVGEVTLTNYPPDKPAWKTLRDYGRQRYPGYEIYVFFLNRIADASVVNDFGKPNVNWQEDELQNAIRAFNQAQDRKNVCEASSPEEFEDWAAGFEQGDYAFHPQSGFEKEGSIFINGGGVMASVMPLVVAHEVGHYVFYPLYGENCHSNDQKMIMWPTLSQSCAFREGEWRVVEKR
ncbi:MAG: hypothetical protein PHN49_12190, partial [Candidatus Omnitrophica bacterium]|nr:hypothetical protein [Candidatus Omnitrophota bacterium]